MRTREQLFLYGKTDSESNVIKDKNSNDKFTQEDLTENTLATQPIHIRHEIPRLHG